MLYIYNLFNLEYYLYFKIIIKKLGYLMKVWWIIFNVVLNFNGKYCKTSTILNYLKEIKYSSANLAI